MSGFDRMDGLNDDEKIYLQRPLKSIQKYFGESPGKSSIDYQAPRDNSSQFPMRNW